MRPIPSLPAISFSAEATSSAWERLSSWHGPAMIEIGKSLPNLTEPVVTTGAAEVFAFKGFRSCCRADHAGPSLGINLVRGLEYQGCAVGQIRRHHQPPNMAFGRNSARPERGFRLADIGHFKAHGV